MQRAVMRYSRLKACDACCRRLATHQLPACADSRFRPDKITGETCSYASSAVGLPELCTCERNAGLHRKAYAMQVTTSKEDLIIVCSLL